jgi:tetratricopeptide (TPR) repeat protein
LAEYDKVIQLQPNWYAPYSERAVIYVYQSHFDLAIADATKVIRLRPDEALGYGLRAAAYLAKGLYRPAISDATRAVALGGEGQYISFMTRGAALLYAGKAADATFDLSMAITLKHDTDDAYYSRGLANEALGSRDRARRDYAKALALLNSKFTGTSRDCFVFMLRGAVFERIGREDEAIVDETRVLAMDCPSPADAYVARGLAYDRKGLRAKAAADLQSAVRINKFSKLGWNWMKRLDARLAVHR